MQKTRWIIPLLIILLGQLSCTVLEEKVVLNGVSMEPNYHDGQVFRVESISPADLKRGDVILFKPKDGRYLKRVVGLPNETIEIRGGQIFINDAPLVEPYVVAAPRYIVSKLSLGEDEYFVLGDNRNNSSDSHNWGPVKWDQIAGRAIPVNP